MLLGLGSQEKGISRELCTYLCMYIGRSLGRICPRNEVLGWMDGWMDGWTGISVALPPPAAAGYPSG